MEVNPSRVYIPLKQHVGEKAVPIVSEGEFVKKAQLIAKINNGKLGANIHASIGGRVQEVNQDMLIIERVK